MFFSFSFPDYLLAKYVPTEGFVIKKVNLRRKPKKKSKAIYVFKKNTKLKIKKVSKKKKWYKVSNGKKVGWVNAKKIQITAGYEDTTPTKEQITELDRDLDKSLTQLMIPKNLGFFSDKSVLMDESSFSTVESSPDDFEAVDVTDGFDALFMSLANEDDANDNDNDEDDSNTTPDETTVPDDTDTTNTD